MGKRFIGIDVGGTTMKLGVVDERGRLLHKAETPTPSDGQAGLSQMAFQARRIAGEAGISWEQVAGLGLGLPGFLDIPAGKIIRLTNLPWENMPVKDHLEAELNIPVAIDNDANVAALGEAWSGAGAGLQDLVCITLGTGVGGGVITGRRLVHGVSGLAGEIGHIRVEEDGALCGCGQRGCVETVSSATGMVRLVKEAVAEGRKSQLEVQVREGTISARDIFEAADKEDPVALTVIDRATDALAKVMSILSVVLNPAAFIIGGGVSRAKERLFSPLRRAYARHTLAHAAAGVRILPAELGNDAGLIGAAGLTAKWETLG
ncbi:glucokinase [Melghirimyces profundicolus]|uniref:Glucokinase n=1 Tax=Melghirimyces profundicolus TaxID=1242148 RepID=A0A2T6BU89_9BACL|nr:ROK family glucokinase [Melghirimyces profundicolus]PTX59623.1 glucokinase [Melghirimyces profundicolus]